MNGAIFIDGFLRRSSGKELLEKRLNARLSLYAGEWFLEPTEGINWWELKTINPDTVAIERVVRGALTRDQEVLSIISIDIVVVDSQEKVEQYNKPLRTLIISAVINTIYGEISI